MAKKKMAKRKSVKKNPTLSEQLAEERKKIRQLLRQLKMVEKERDNYMLQYGIVTVERESLRQALIDQDRRMEEVVKRGNELGEKHAVAVSELEQLERQYKEVCARARDKERLQSLVCELRTERKGSERTLKLIFGAMSGNLADDPL